VTHGPVTLLLPTYNRARALEAVWPCYTRIPEVSRIIVVDDGSTDATPRLLTRLTAESPIPMVVIRHDVKKGQQAARMAGIAAADTPWVMFGEDDVWLGDGYCTTLLRDAGVAGAAAIAGRLVTARVQGEFDPAALEDPDFGHVDSIADMTMIDADFALRTSQPIEVPFLHTIALIRRDVFDTVSFDSGYGGNGWREETDFYLSLREMGEKVMFTPDAVCFHLRGPVSAHGGQRIPRWHVEYFAFANTLRLVRKHWALLRSAYKFRGTPLTWTIGFMARRERAQASRWMSGHRSTFRT
jgi:glycosyltransferase involved in cell wall biosynthesis